MYIIPKIIGRTWNEAIEAAAKYHDKNADACRKLAVEGIEADSNADAAAEHEIHASHIRALARKETP